MRLFWMMGACLLATSVIGQQATISSLGVGELRILKTHRQVEQVLGKQLPVRSKQAADNGMDTVWADYQGLRLRLVFSYYTLMDDDLPSPKLYSLYTEASGAKTRSGIAPGDDKFDIIRKLDGRRLTVGPDWRKEDMPDKQRYSAVRLSDYDNSTYLCFYFIDNKLVAFEVGVEEGC